MSILKSELMRTYDASKVTAEGIMYIAEIVDRTVKRALKERPKGEWDYSDDMYETRVCSVCGFDTEDYKEYNFCPNCGADMRGADDEEPV